MSTGSSITQAIIDNKDRIKYLCERYTDTCSYHLFKFKSKLRNIFGFHKCFLIEVYEDLTNYKYGDVLKMYLRLPFYWNAVEIPSSFPEAKKISRILYDIWVKAEYKDDLKTREKIGKLC